MLKTILSMFRSLLGPWGRAAFLFRVTSIAFPLIHIGYFLLRTHEILIALAMAIAVCMAQPPHRNQPTGAYRLWAFSSRIMIIMTAGVFSTFAPPYDLDVMIHSGWSRWIPSLLSATVFTISDLISEAHYRELHRFILEIEQKIVIGPCSFAMNFHLPVAANVELYVRSSQTLRNGIRAKLSTLNVDVLRELSQSGDQANAQLNLLPGSYVLLITIDDLVCSRIVAHAVVTPSRTPHEPDPRLRVLQKPAILFQGIADRNKLVEEVQPISAKTRSACGSSEQVDPPMNAIPIAPPGAHGEEPSTVASKGDEDDHRVYPGYS